MRGTARSLLAIPALALALALDGAACRKADPPAPPPDPLPTLQGTWFVRYLSDPNPYLDVAFAEGDDAAIASAVADLRGPGDALYRELPLRFGADDREWQIVVDQLPRELAGGLWWIARLRVLLFDGRWVEWTADDPRGGYTRTHGDGVTTASPPGGEPVDAWLGPFYATEAGSPRVHVGTYAADGGAPIDTMLRVYRADEPTRWIALCDDPDVADAMAKLALPVTAGERYLVQVDGMGDDGAYVVAVTTGGPLADPALARLVPSAAEPNDTPEQASTLHVGAPQRHTLERSEHADRDWFVFTAPAD